MSVGVELDAPALAREQPILEERLEVSDAARHRGRARSELLRGARDVLLLRDEAERREVGPHPRDALGSLHASLYARRVLQSRLRHARSAVAVDAIGVRVSARAGASAKPSQTFRVVGPHAATARRPLEECS